MMDLGREPQYLQRAQASLWSSKTLIRCKLLLLDKRRVLPIRAIPQGLQRFPSMLLSSGTGLRSVAAELRKPLPTWSVCSILLLLRRLRAH